MGGFTQLGFGLYLDPNLVHPVISETLTPPFTFQLGGAYIGFAIDINNLDVTSQQGDVQVWLGSPTDPATNFLKDEGNPGVTNISISSADSFVPVGSSPNPTTRLYLALTEAGLNSAVGGAGLSLGVPVISGGVQNAVTFWVRYKVPVPSPEFSCQETVYTNLYIGTEPVLYYKNT